MAQTPVAQTSLPLQPIKILPPSPNSSPSRKSHSSSIHKKLFSNTTKSNLSMSVSASTPKSSIAIRRDTHTQNSKSKNQIIGKTSSRASTPFKVPTTIRFMTPSTSTVAASSSPGRIDHSIFSSSPVSSKRTKTPIFKNVTVNAGTTLIFGRHRNQLPTSSSPSTSSIPLESSIPSSIHLLSFPNNSTETISLPRTAQHASRIHAVMEYNSQSDSIRILVMGQNGVRVRSGTKKRRLRVGEVMDIQRNQGDSAAEVDFYGCRIGVSFPPAVLEQSGRSRSTTPTHVEVLNLPPSSPPMMMESMDVDEDMDISEDDVVKNQAVPAVSSPQIAPSSPMEDLFGDEPLSEISSLSAPEDDRAIKEELVEAANHAASVDLSSKLPTPPNSSTLPSTFTESRGSILEASKSKPPSRVSSPEPPLPEEHRDNLPAILAATVVFSGSSKLSLPDLVRHMLESTPSMRDHGDETAWSKWVIKILNSNSMFGKVERHGKDSSGHPLLPHYFYRPEEDPDTDRAAELGSLVRPLRAAQRAGGKAIDWRPVGRRR